MLKNFNQQRAENKKLMKEIDGQRKDKLAMYDKIDYLSKSYMDNHENGSNISQMVSIRR